MVPGQISHGTLVWSKTTIQFHKIPKNTARIVQTSPVMPAGEMTALWCDRAELLGWLSENSDQKL